MPMYIYEVDESSIQRVSRHVCYRVYRRHSSVLKNGLGIQVRSLKSPNYFEGE